MVVWPLEKVEKVGPIAAAEHRGRALSEVVVAQESPAPSHLFGRADLQTLTMLNRTDEVPGLVQRLERSRVEPGSPPLKDLDL